MWVFQNSRWDMKKDWINGSGKKCEAYGYILKAEPTAFAERLDTGCEKKSGVSDNAKVLDWTIGIAINWEREDYKCIKLKGMIRVQCLIY